MPSSPALLQLEDVSKRYDEDRPALVDVDLEVRRGECVVLVGESGCGKSTLLKLCNRLLEPSAGSVRLGGRPLAALDPVELRRGIGYVQQEGGLIPHWTVATNVELVPRLRGWPRERRSRRADEMLAAVELAPERFRHRYPAELSGGQRQRVAVARALAAEPELVLLDEPFGALDAITRRQLQRWLVELRATVETTLLMVTHDLDEATLLGDRVAVLRDGRVLQVGAPRELVAAPADAYVARLVAAGRRPEVP